MVAASAEKKMHDRAFAQDGGSKLCKTCSTNLPTAPASRSRAWFLRTFSSDRVNWPWRVSRL
jgi:hypothetical protein